MNSSNVAKITSPDLFQRTLPPLLGRGVQCTYQKSLGLLVETSDNVYTGRMKFSSENTINERGGLLRRRKYNSAESTLNPGLKHSNRKSWFTRHKSEGNLLYIDYIHFPDIHERGGALIGNRIFPDKLSNKRQRETISTPSRKKCINTNQVTKVTLKENYAKGHVQHSITLGTTTNLQGFQQKFPPKHGENIPVPKGHNKHGNGDKDINVTRNPMLCVSAIKYGKAEASLKSPEENLSDGGNALHGKWDSYLNTSVLLSRVYLMTPSVVVLSMNLSVI